MTSVTPEFPGAQPPELPNISFEVELLAESALLNTGQALLGATADADQVRDTYNINREVAQASGLTSQEDIEQIAVCWAAAAPILEAITAHCEMIFDGQVASPDQSLVRGMNSRLYADVLSTGLEACQYAGYKPCHVMPSDALAVCRSVVLSALEAGWTETNLRISISAMTYEADDLAPGLSAPDSPTTPEYPIPDLPADLEFYIESKLGRLQLALEQCDLPESSEMQEVYDEAYAHRLENELNETSDDKRSYEERQQAAETGGNLDTVCYLILNDLLPHLGRLSDDGSLLPDSERYSRGIQSRLYADMLTVGRQIIDWAGQTPEVGQQASDAHAACVTVTILMIDCLGSDAKVYNAIATLNDDADRLAPLPGPDPDLAE